MPPVEAARAARRACAACGVRGRRLGHCVDPVRYCTSASICGVGELTLERRHPAAAPCGSAASTPSGGERELVEVRADVAARPGLGQRVAPAAPCSRRHPWRRSRRRCRRRRRPALLARPARRTRPASSTIARVRMSAWPRPQSSVQTIAVVPDLRRRDRRSSSRSRARRPASARTPAPRTSGSRRARSARASSSGRAAGRGSSPSTPPCSG